MSHAPILFASLLLISIPALAVEGVMLRDDTLRGEPNANALSLGTAKKNVAVEILESRGGWTRIRYGAGRGWVRLLYVRRGVASAADLRGTLESAKDLASSRPDLGKITATAGLRGLDEADLKGAQFNESELQRLDAHAVTPDTARKFAQDGALKARTLAYLPEPKQETGKAGGGFDFLGGL